MTYQGHVKSGAIVLDTPVMLPDGATVEVAVVQPTETPPNHKPIWEIAVDLANSIPEEDVKAMPTDASKNLDHYLYGVPKEEP